MKVLIVNPEFYVYGGAERLIIKLANYLTEHNIENAILTKRMIPKVRKELKDTRIIIANDLRQILLSIMHEYDVINPHNHPAELASYPATKPQVWMCNEPPIEVFMGKDFPEIQKEIVRESIDIAVVADEFNKKRFKELYGLDAVINPYGIDYDYFAEPPSDIQSVKYNLKERDFVILQVGMLTFTKNQLKSVQILKELKKEIPNVKLILAGYDKLPYKQEVDSYILANDLDDNVIFTGEVNQEELRDLYYVSDLVIAPIMAQGGWLSTFEAIACNKPIIVSPEMTVSDIIKKHKLGIVSKDFVKDILKESERTDYHTIDRKWIKENLTWDKFCGNMVGYFEEAIEGN
jgi:glycosyltransferase involved in cell wall biosynthesis